MQGVTSEITGVSYFDVLINTWHVVHAQANPHAIASFCSHGMNLHRIYSDVPDTSPTPLAVGASSDEQQAHIKSAFKHKHRNMRRKWQVNVNFPDTSVMDAYWRPRVDSSLEPFQWAMPDLPALRLFCQEKLGWSLAKCDSKLLPVINSLTNGQMTQSRLESFFNYDEKAASIRSSRLRHAVRQLTHAEEENDDFESGRAMCVMSADT